MRVDIWFSCFLLARACSERVAEPAQAAEQKPPLVNGTRVVIIEEPPADNPPAQRGAKQANPCLTQDDESVTRKLKAVGTEPFWAAEVEGRCVTYKTPEDQQGTRLWTHVDTGPDGPAWNGALRGRQFQLYVRPAAPPGCSDGMSDKVYPLEAVLHVDGETRRGCAEGR